MPELISSEVPLIKLESFGQHIKSFCANELTQILTRYPFLEFPHKQDYYMLVYIESADGNIIIDGQKIRLEPDKIIILKPRCISSWDINASAKGILIGFSEDFFSLRYNNNVLYQFSFLKSDALPYLRLDSEKRTKWHTLLELLMDEYTQDKTGSKNVLRSYLNILMFEIERMYYPLARVKNVSLKKEKMHQFEMLLDEHFATKKLPSAYADMLNITANYLNKICKEETGHTAGEIIRKRITIEAQRLLRYTRLNINEIADKLGFENTSYFITFFKKQTGETPEHFRKGAY